MSPSSSCQQCARLLKKVLSHENSRPMTLLEAIGSKKEIEEEGKASLKLRVPRPTGLPLREWEDLRIRQEEGEEGSFSSRYRFPGTAKPMIATSAAATPTATDAISVDQSENDDGIVYEPLKIECRPCANVGPERAARAFVMGPTPLSIVLCSNRLSLHSTDEMEQVLVHELMHVYDVRVNRLNLRQCENLAYSEVRAAREAECQSAWLPDRFCIPEKAFRATSNLFPPDVARACMKKVFTTALNDMAPLHPPKINENNKNSVRKASTSKNNISKSFEYSKTTNATSTSIDDDKLDKNLRRRGTCHSVETAPSSDR